MSVLLRHILSNFGLFPVMLLVASISVAQQNQMIELWAEAQAQILLDQAGFSPGEIDGRTGYNTLKALNTYQQVRGLPVTDELDKYTMSVLSASGKQLLTEYTITLQDLQGPFVQIPRDFMEKARLKRMHYSSAQEAISEKFHINPDLLIELNPGASFQAGEQIIVPNVPSDVPVIRGGNLSVIVSGDSSDVTVRLNGHIIFYAPISHGGERDPLPLGKRKVNGIIKNPHYRYDPKLFWDADPNHKPALLAPGPNNPVGEVWIAINFQHYGLHGTPEPSSIGYGQSHGCIRLTNWDARKLAAIVKAGTEIVFQ